jgi:hypothetical protein
MACPHDAHSLFVSFSAFFAGPAKYTTATRASAWFRIWRIDSARQARKFVSPMFMPVDKLNFLSLPPESAHRPVSEDGDFEWRI